MLGYPLEISVRRKLKYKCEFEVAVILAFPVRDEPTEERRSPHDAGAEAFVVKAVELPRVVHALPGRIRLHLPAWDGADRAPIERGLLRLDGVRSARANVTTRNVVVHFDAAAIDEAALIRAAALLALHPDPGGEDATARERSEVAVLRLPVPASDAAGVESPGGVAPFRAAEDRAREPASLLAWLWERVRDLFRRAGAVLVRIVSSGPELLPHLPKLVLVIGSLATASGPLSLAMAGADAIHLASSLHAALAT